MTEGKRLVVLIVDDNHDAVDVMAMLVAEKGHEPLVAYDPISGLKVASDFLPDLALVDLGMPFLTGFDVATRLRNDPRFDRTLLVAVTAREDAEVQARRAGFDGYVVKPLENSVLDVWLSRADEVRLPPPLF